MAEGPAQEGGRLHDPTAVHELVPRSLPRGHNQVGYIGQLGQLGSLLGKAQSSGGAQTAGRNNE